MVNYIGFWKRVLSYLIDALILGVGLVIIETVLGIDTSHVKKLTIDANGDYNYQSFGYYNLCNLFVWFVYETLMVGSKFQGTLGKSIMGYVVVNENFDKVSYQQAALRFFGKIVDTFTLAIGYIMIGFTEKKRGLHDYIAKTYVVDNNSLPLEKQAKPFIKSNKKL